MLREPGVHKKRNSWILLLDIGIQNHVRARERTVCGDVINIFFSTFREYAVQLRTKVKCLDRRDHTLWIVSTKLKFEPEQSNSRLVN